jgi:hypothetical protein
VRAHKIPSLLNLYLWGHMTQVLEFFSYQLNRVLLVNGHTFYLQLLKVDLEAYIYQGLEGIFFILMKIKKSQIELAIDLYQMKCQIFNFGRNLPYYNFQEVEIVIFQEKELCYHNRKSWFLLL